jgi:two-component system LytT family response regulator
MTSDNRIIKTVIVEDDPISMKLLMEFLKRYDFIEILDQASTFDIAEEVLKKHKDIDLLITDIDLQGASALDLIRFVKPKTQILFTTSFAEFAVKAFEFNTVDYILKPISIDRLEKAMSRINLLPQTAIAQEEQPTDSVAAAMQNDSKLSYDNLILMNINEELRFIKVKEINMILAKGNYATISLDDGNEITAYGLIKLWEDKLPTEHFIRIHRSTIVNLNNVIKIEKGTYDTGLLYLKGVGQPLEISRNYFSLIKHRFKLTSNLFH